MLAKTLIEYVIATKGRMYRPHTALALRLMQLKPLIKVHTTAKAPTCCLHCLRIVHSSPAYYGNLWLTCPNCDSDFLCGRRGEDRELDIKHMLAQLHRLEYIKRERDYLTCIVIARLDISRRLAQIEYNLERIEN